MFVRFGKILVVAVVVLTTGLHWAALQSVAWTAMFAKNIRAECFAQAVTTTFDGKHPCCLCKAIAAAQKSEKKSEAVSFAVKMEFPPVPPAVAVYPPSQFVVIRPGDSFADLLPSKPPLPPPRFFLV